MEEVALTTTAAEQEDEGATMATGLDGAFQVGRLDVSAMHEKVLSIFRAMQTTVNCPYYLGLGGCVTSSIMDYLDYIVFCINTYYVLSNPATNQTNQPRSLRYLCVRVPRLATPSGGVARGED